MSRIRRGADEDSAGGDRGRSLHLYNYLGLECCILSWLSMDVG